MLSLETAKKLKEAGLPWEPKLGDWYFYENLYTRKWEPTVIESEAEENAKCFLEADLFIFAPRLDQLLAEIEGRDATWDMNCGNLPNNVRRYRCSVTIGHWELNEFRRDAFMIFKDDSPGEATAQALLWILEQEKGAK